jgi:hypothetical protein
MNLPNKIEKQQVELALGCTGFTSICLTLFLILPAVAAELLSFAILFGNNSHKIIGFVFINGVGSGLLFMAALAITGRIELTSTSITYKNFCRVKSLMMNQIVSIERHRTKSGSTLKIITNTDQLLLGYLTFSESQLVSIENLIRIKIAK